MGLLDLFNTKKKADLLELQKLVMKDSPDKLIFSENALKEMAASAAQRDLEIVQDCVRIVQETKKPDVFFSRLDLLIQKADNLRKYEKYLKFSVSPSAAYSEIWSDYQKCIQQFLVRYFCDTFDKAEKLKTDKGKLNKYTAFHESLQPYYERMTEENIDYIETKFNAYTRYLKGK